jgi:hypothetical protein
MGCYTGLLPYISKLGQFQPVLHGSGTIGVVAASEPVSAAFQHSVGQAGHVLEEVVKETRSRRQTVLE